jgi:hypothetical protein
MNTNTQADEILSIALNVADAMDRAESAPSEINQDWDHESTLYTLPDGSVLVVNGTEVNAYDSMESARSALDD